MGSFVVKVEASRPEGPHLVLRTHFCHVLHVLFIEVNVATATEMLFVLGVNGVCESALNPFLSVDFNAFIFLVGCHIEETRNEGLIVFLVSLLVLV